MNAEELRVVHADTAHVAAADGQPLCGADPDAAWAGGAGRCWECKRLVLPLGLDFRSGTGPVLTPRRRRVNAVVLGPHDEVPAPRGPFAATDESPRRQTAEAPEQPSDTRRGDDGGPHGPDEEKR
jgi:hypothetical protein